MMNKTKTKMTLMARAFGLLLMLVAGTMTGYAQNNVEYFTYEDNEAENGKTIINGLTSNGETATELTIPATVTTVRSGAFSEARNDNYPLTVLTIDGGNPSFEGSLFGRTSTLTGIDMGKKMSVANMKALLNSIGTGSPLKTVDIKGYTGTPESWTTLCWESECLTKNVDIRIPAELITDDQVFGNAKVYGRFTIDKEIISFCTNATFLDEDTGSNMLFYVADGIADDGRLHIQRVWYIAAGKGVLIHRTENSSGYADLQRTGDLEDGTTQANTDKALYAQNMLVGVTEATKIGKVSGDKTNYVLKDGAFHPTSGGTIKANRAYLQIPTASARTESLAISFDEETGISDATHLNDKGEMINDNVYDLQGRKVHTLTKGLYINNGKKYVIK